MTVYDTKVVTGPAHFMAQDSVVRPDNTTAYAAGDAISDNATTPTSAGAFALECARRPGGSGVISEVILLKDDDDVTNADFDLLLFHTLPAFAGWEDNAPLAITAEEMKDLVAAYTFAAASWVDVNTANVQVATLDHERPFVCAPSDTNLYGILVAGGAYTPAAEEEFTITIGGLRD